MSKLFKEYIEDMKSLMSKKGYIVPLILVAILSFGFVVTHYSINIDTLSANRYYEEGMLIGQNRVTATVLEKIFNIMEYNPFFVDFIAVVFLVLSAISFCVLFKRVKDNSNILPFTAFSCIFVSYPLINEIFVYTPASLSIAIGYFMTAISLIIMNEFIKENKMIYMIFSTILLFLAISLYESFMTVYLAAIFMILLLENISSGEKIQINKLFFKVVYFIIPAIISLMLLIIIPQVIIKIFGVEQNHFAQKTIYYQLLGFIETLKNLKNTLLIKYCINALFYLPITGFVVSNIILFTISIIATIKKKKPLIFLIYIFLFISTISLSIIQGFASPYRTCQSFAVFCGFAFMILCYTIINCNIKKRFKNIIFVLIFILVFYQAKNLHQIFYLNYIRYEQEKNTLIKICNEIESKYGLDKPVVFVGQYQLSDYIIEKAYVDKDDVRIKIANKILKIFNIDSRIKNNYKYIETNISSYLTWGTSAFGEANTEIYKWIDMLGYNLKQPDIQMLNEANEYIKGTNQYNLKETVIIEIEDYIIVNL